MTQAPFKKGDWVAFENGHGRRGAGYEGDGVVEYVQEMASGDLLWLEEGNVAGSRIKVLASDCRPSQAPLIAARAQLAASIARYHAARHAEDQTGGRP